MATRRRAMPRPTPSFKLRNEDIISIGNIRANSTPDSPMFKRASILLACHDGLSGKEIAAKYSVTPNMVINWRRRYEEKGIEGIYDEHRTGRRNIGVSADEKVQEIIQQHKQEGVKYSAKSLAEEIGVSISTVKRALSRLGIVISRHRSWNIDVDSMLLCKYVKIVGLYISTLCHILVLMIHKSDNIDSSGNGFVVTTNSSLSKAIESNKPSDGALSLTKALCSARISSTNKTTSGRAISPKSFIENFTSKDDDTDYIIVIHGDQEALQGSTFHSVATNTPSEWFDCTKAWINALDKKSNSGELLTNELSNWINSKSQEYEPFIWYIKNSLDHIENESDIWKTNTDKNYETLVKITYEYKDNEGNSITSHIESYDQIPKISSIDDVNNLNEYKNNVSNIEKAVREMRDEVTNQFYGKLLNSNQKKTTSKNTE